MELTTRRGGARCGEGFTLMHNDIKRVVYLLCTTRIPGHGNAFFRVALKTVEARLLLNKTKHERLPVVASPWWRCNFVAGREGSLAGRLPPPSAHHSFITHEVVQ
jgi:hypothetical protein